MERFLLSIPGQVVVRHDGDGRIRWISPGSESVFGKHRSVLLSTDTNERIHDSVPSAYRRALDKNMAALRGGRSVECTYRLATGEGTRCWVESIFIPVVDDRGQLVEIRSLTHDIDRFKRPLEEISVRNRHWHSALDGVPVVLVQVGPDLQILSANRSAETIFKQKPRRLLGRDVVSLLCAAESPEETTLRHQLLHSRYGETELWSGTLERWLNVAYYSATDADGNLHEGLLRLLDVTPRKTIEEKLHRSLAAMRQLAARLQSVREEERARISREIHDELGHQLTGLSLNLGWLRDRLGTESDVLTQQVDYMLSILDSTWGALRRISTELRPAVLDHLGLPAAVQWQCDDFREHSGIALDLELGDLGRNVTPAVTTTLFRVLQEALTNVARHSGATHVEVALRQLDDQLVLVVVDDGHGFDPAARADSVTCGLFGMEQRAHELQGHWSLESAPGQGTRVEIRVPIS